MDPPGDPAVFCADLHRRLLGSMVLFCGDRMLAEEITQEALARALERWRYVGAMASPEAWTYRVAFNLGRSWFRRLGSERRANERIARGEVVAPLPDAAAAVAVREAVLALPERQRGVIVARYFAGLSIEETAEAMHCAQGTVKSLTHKALQNLRRTGLGNGEEVEIDAAT